MNDYLSAVPRAQLFDAVAKLGIRPRFDASQEELVKIIRDQIKQTDIKQEKDLQGESLDYRLDNIVKNVLIALIISILLFFVVLIFNISRPTKKSFCDSGTTSKTCIRCPSNADCSEGKAYCRPGFKLLHHLCILDDDDAIYVSSLVEYEMKLLEKQAGLYECKTSKTKYISTNDLIIQMIRHSKFKNIDIEYMANKAIDHLIFEDSVSNISEKNEIYYASDYIQRPISCVIRQNIESHIISVLFASFLLLATAIYIFIQSNIRNRKQQSFLIAQSIASSYNKYSFPVTEAAIRSNLKNVAPEYENLMPYVLNELKRNPKVKTSFNAGSFTFRFD